jgi:hypothetical protein
MMTPDEIARGLTGAQRAAFKWLKEHGGDACFDKHGVAFAMGETAETTRTVWNALEKAGLIYFYGGKRDGGKGYGRLAVRKIIQEQNNAEV